MKISKETIDILKNYAGISSSILIKPGQNLSTMAPASHILSTCQVPEDFPVEIPIYDLNKFLAALSLFKDPDVDFKEKYALISEGGSSIRFFYADPSLINAAKSLKMPKTVVDVKLSAKNLAELQKAAAVLQVEDFCFFSKNGQVYVSASNKKDNSSNNFELCLGAYPNNDEFKYFIKADYIRFVPMDYTLSFAANSAVMFKGSNFDLTYFVSLETDSYFKPAKN